MVISAKQRGEKQRQTQTQGNGQLAERAIFLNQHCELLFDAMLNSIVLDSLCFPGFRSSSHSSNDNNGHRSGNRPTESTHDDDEGIIIIMTQ
jgi:hypothetical protein